LAGFGLSGMAHAMTKGLYLFVFFVFYSLAIVPSVALSGELPPADWSFYDATNDGAKTKLHTDTSTARFGHPAMLDNQRGTYVYKDEDPATDIVNLILFIRTNNAVALKDEVTLIGMNDAASLHNLRMTARRGLVMGFDSSARQGKLSLYGIDDSYDRFTSPTEIDTHDITGFTSSNVENIDRATDTKAFMAMSDLAVSGHVVIVETTNDTISQGTPVDFTTAPNDTITLSGAICALSANDGFYIADKKVHYFTVSGTIPTRVSSAEYLGGAAAGERRITRISENEAVLVYETQETGGVLKAVALKYDKTRDGAPKVTAKGKGRVAENIIELAREHGIPVKDDPDLVEVLSSLELDQEIPSEIYVAVAELLAFVYSANSEKS